MRPQPVTGGANNTVPSQMTRESILAALRDAAAENGGRPLGARAFHAATGISRNEMWKAGFAKYNDAVIAAGLTPNKLMTARDTDDTLASLALLAKTIGRFPTIGDLKVARSRDPRFPSYEALHRLAGGSWTDLPSLLLTFCQDRTEYSDVRLMLAPLLGPSQKKAPVGSGSGRVVGYVYLGRHGRDYKIGRSNDVARRRREISLLLPSELEHVHVIETDDPEGIEHYWHRRFEKRRVRGEWFRLTPSDVSAFKRRRYQ